MMIEFPPYQATVRLQGGYIDMSEGVENVCRLYMSLCPVAGFVWLDKFYEIHCSCSRADEGKGVRCAKGPAYVVRTRSYIDVVVVSPATLRAVFDLILLTTRNKRVCIRGMLVLYHGREQTSVPFAEVCFESDIRPLASPVSNVDINVFSCTIYHGRHTHLHTYCARGRHRGHLTTSDTEVRFDSNGKALMQLKFKQLAEAGPSTGRHPDNFQDILVKALIQRPD